MPVISGHHRQPNSRMHALLCSTALATALLASPIAAARAEAQVLIEDTWTIASDEQLGDPSQALIFNGGTLHNTAAFTTGRNIHLDDLGGTFQTDADLTLGGVVTGQGILTKTGAATLSLAGQDIAAGGLLVDAGTVDIAARLEAATGVIDASEAMGTAAVRVAGTGMWTGNILMVGDQGRGELVIENGGSVVSDMVAVAHNHGGIGVVSISGPGSSLNSGGMVSVGHYGQGTLAVENEGRLSAVGVAIGAGHSHATGTVTVAGEGSVLEAGDSALGWSLAVGLYGNGTLALSEGGRAAAPGGVTVAEMEDAVGRIVFGAASGEEARTAGTLDAASVRFGAGDGSLIFNHAGNPDGTDFVFSSTLLGGGRVLHENGMTLFTGDSSAFAGTTTVSGGTLLVGDRDGSGALGGRIDVFGGGTLGGSGVVSTAGSVTAIADGGRIAPGNSLGTLTVAGNLALSPGSFLDFELGRPGASAGAPGTSDRIDVAGDLILDGTLNLTQSGNAGDGTAGFGYYRLMTYGGTLSDNGLEIGDTAVAGDHEIQATNGNVDLYIASLGDDTLQHWQGGDGSWHATEQKWLNQGSATPVSWAGNHAVFKNEPGGFAGGTVTVEDAQGFKGLQFVDSGYRLAGPGTLVIDGSQSADGNAEIRVLAGTTAEIATTINGTGGITRTGGGVLLLTGGSAFGGDLTVSTGTLTITDGGTVKNADGTIAAGAGSSAVVNVDGPGATWSSDRLRVGYDGAGELNVTGGGEVNVTNGSAFIGGWPGHYGTGKVTVSGNGSVWNNRFGLDVGQGGAGELIIADGGEVNQENGFVGGFATSGTVRVSGPESKWISRNLLAIGFLGQADVTVGAGGLIQSVQGRIGAYADVLPGVATITGEGSAWINEGEIHVGAGGTGTLTVADGGEVSSGGAITLAREATAAGTLNIGAAAGDAAAAAGILNTPSIAFGEGTGTLVFNHIEPDHAFSTALESVGGGTHAISHLAGRTIYTGNGSQFDGATTVSGGTLVVAEELGGSASVTGGALVVDGTFGGDVGARMGGRVSGTGMIAGDADFTGGGRLAGKQGQTLSIAGNLAMDASSVVDVALGGAPAHALFDVGGSLTLGGTLNIADQGGFGAGVYRLFDYAGTLGGGGLAIGGTPAGVSADNLAIQTSMDHQVNLLSSLDATLGFWDGGDTALHDNDEVNGGSGSWRADGRNWTDAAGTVNGPFQPNPTFAVFQGTSGTVSVDDSAGAIGVTGMQFATDGYRLEGEAVALEGRGGESIIRVGDGTGAGAAMTSTIAAELTGGSTLVKSDHGTLVLAGANSHTGGTRIDAGILSVSDDRNLGHADGALVFNGGTLAVTGDMENARAVTLARDGGFDIAAGTVLGLSGPVAGAGNLVKTGGGTLRLAGANAYGDTVVREGELIGDAASISGNIVNDGAVAFEQFDDGRFSGDIGGSGIMRKTGSGTLTLGGVSTLDWTVERGTLASAANRFTGDVAIGGDGVFNFDQDGDAAYAGIISGTGRFSLDGGGAVLLTGDSSGFAGTTRIGAGTLLVGAAAGNGALGGSTDVLSGGTLAGSGTVGSGMGSLVTVAAGGMLSPGNSIGTLTVDGDLLLEAGSRFAVEVDPRGTASDLVTVTGAATLDGGAVAHIGAAGDYDLRSAYTILSAGALSGAFDAVTSDFAFLTPELIYDYGAGTVGLELSRNDTGFASKALTRNQKAAAGGIESIGFGAGHAVYDAVVRLADDGYLIRASFDALSGEIHGSARTALVEDSRFVRNATNDRIRAAFATAGASHAPVLAHGPGGTAAVAADHAGPAFWSYGFGSWGSSDSDGNAAQFDRGTGGLLVGADALAGDWRFGLLAGYGHSHFTIGDRASSGSSDNYHLGLYGGTQWGDLAFRAGAAYSWHNIDTSRAVAIPALSEHLSADYSAGTFQAFGELGYGVDFGNGTRLEPFASLAHVSLHTDGFTERGGAAALSGYSGSTDVTFTTLGLRGEHAVTFGAMEAALKGMIGWRHAFGDTIPQSTHAFSAGDAFTVAGVPISRDSLVIEAGLDLAITADTTFGLSYTGQLSRSAQDHGFKANLSVRF